MKCPLAITNWNHLVGFLCYFFSLLKANCMGKKPSSSLCIIIFESSRGLLGSIHIDSKLPCLFQFFIMINHVQDILRHCKIIIRSYITILVLGNITSTIYYTSVKKYYKYIHIRIGGISTRILTKTSFYSILDKTLHSLTFKLNLVI